MQLQAQEERIELMGTLTHDAWVNRGGLRESMKHYGNLDLLGNLFLWKNGEFRFHGIYNYGHLLSEQMGDLQIANNMEAPRGFKIYEFWYRHQWKNGSVVLGGQDVNNTFGATENGAFFVNSSFGMGPELTVNFPLSTFPYTGLGVALRQKINANIDLRIGVFDGYPGVDSSIPWRERSAIKAEEGSFWIGELQFDRWGSHRLGTWYQTKTPSGASLRGFYLIGDIALASQNNTHKGWGLFYQLGWVENEAPVARSYQGIGTVYRGLLTPKKDALGIAFGQVQLSDLWQQQTSRKNESVLEVSYSYAPSTYLRIQPNWQYVFNPAQQGGISNTSVLFLRVQIGAL